MAEVRRIPRQAADRFALTFTEFVAGVRSALALVPDHPSVAPWHNKALPLLDGDLRSLDAAINSYAAGDAKPLVQSASSALSLAKKMDGLPLDFAGEELGSKIAEQRRFVVMAAWQVLQAAGLV